MRSLVLGGKGVGSQRRCEEHEGEERGDKRGELGGGERGQEGGVRGRREGTRGGRKGGRKGGTRGGEEGKRGGEEGGGELMIDIKGGGKEKRGKEGGGSYLGERGYAKVMWGCTALEESFPPFGENFPPARSGERFSSASRISLILSMSA